MKRLIALCLVPLLLLAGFYGGWPAWTGHQIATALKTGDSATLDRKIVFDDVRSSLRPAAELKIGEVYDAYQARAGSAGPIIGQIKADVVPKIVDVALRTLVTPENLVRLARARGTWKESSERILTEQVAKIGLPGLRVSFPPDRGSDTGLQSPDGTKPLGGIAGLAGQIPGLSGITRRSDAAPQTSPKRDEDAAAGADNPTYGLSNVKHFSMLGALAFEIGIAKDATAKESDVIVEMRFVDGDWRVTGVRPRI